MVISIFYAICALGVLFFSAFFIQCCRLASRKTTHVIGELSPAGTFDSDQTTRLLGQWEQEMAEFMARQGRGAALVFLMSMTSTGLLRSAIPSERSDSMLKQGKHCTSLLLDQSTSLRPSQAGQATCKKS
jgi:hypothetical protein